MYPLQNRLRDEGLVTSLWERRDGEPPRRYYTITRPGRESLAAFRGEWERFAATVS